jgi:predicted nucleic acid-binding protein
MELGEPSGNFFFDVHTAALMREHGIRRIASADNDFAKFFTLDFTLIRSNISAPMEHGGGI